MLKAKYPLAAALSVILFGGGVSAKSGNPTHHNGAAQEQAIRKINDRWLALIGLHDAASVSKLYAPDGAMMAPGAPIAQGQPALEKAWSGLMKMPGFGLTFKADQILVASGGDLALDRGTYLLSLSGPHGPTKDIGKYVVVWRNIDGQWRVAADIFNSDGASAP
jgi:uncharacterized protein (TIGR02246 family)